MASAPLHSRLSVDASVTPLLRIVFLTTAVACGRTALPPDGNRSSWPSGMQAWERRTHLVVMNETRAEALIDFPVLVRLDPSRIDYAAVRPGGADLRFIDDDGALLDHEIEQWQAGGDSYVWLRLPALAAGVNHDVWLYYGNSTAGSIEDPAAVWRHGYIAVYHFADASSALPATSAINSGVTFAGEFLGTHASFNGSDGHLSVPAGFSGFAGGLAIEAWVRPNASTNYARVVDFGNGEAIDNIVFYRWGLSDELTYEVHDPGYQFREPGVLVVGAWQYLVVSHAPDGVATLYKDATPLGSAASVPLPSPVTRTMNFIGRSNWVTDDLFAGDMDELRISNVPRSSAWVDAQHASMIGQMVVFDGAEQL
ncbi:MAG: DUF2341 domain-containing protein [Myxococcota bacterium]